MIGPGSDRPTVGGMRGARATVLRSGPGVGSGEFQPGRGFCRGHHGELLQGVAWSPRRSEVVPALVTIPLPRHGASAVFRPHRTHRGVHADGTRGKSVRAAEIVLRTCDDLGLPRPPGGTLQLRSDLPRGCGMGSSTADVVATIRAVCDCCGLPLDDLHVSAIAVQAETASDPLAFDTTPVLFAQRHAEVLRRWDRPLPPVRLVGCRLPGQPVDTLGVSPPAYTSDEHAEFARLTSAMETAVRTGNTRILGGVATDSALINQRYLPKPDLPRVLEICERTGGVGVQVAHSGTVCSVMYDPADAAVDQRILRARRALDAAGFDSTAHFLGEDP